VGAVDESAHGARDDRVTAVTFVVAKLDALGRVEADVRASRVGPSGVALCDELATDDGPQRP
jgi:hypothetical protein